MGSLHEVLVKKELDAYSIIVRWSNDNERLLVGGGGYCNEVIVYNKDMDVVWRKEIEHSHVAISPEGRYPVVVISGKMVFFDIDSDEVIQSCRIKSGVSSIDWSPYGKYIAMGRSDGYVIVYEWTQPMRRLWTHRISREYIPNTRFSPRGDILAVTTRY